MGPAVETALAPESAPDMGTMPSAAGRIEKPQKDKKHKKEKKEKKEKKDKKDGKVIPYTPETRPSTVWACAALHCPQKITMPVLIS